MLNKRKAHKNSEKWARFENYTMIIGRPKGPTVKGIDWIMLETVAEIGQNHNVYSVEVAVV